MVNIPQNNSSDLEAKQKVKHQEEIDFIVNQFLKGLKKSDEAIIDCEEHMIGYHGSREYHHLCDTKEAAMLFKKQGYYCYYYNGYNNHGVNQRAVCVRKTPMLDSDIHRNRNWDWIQI